MFEAIAAILSTSGFGAILGGLGGLASKFASYKLRKLEVAASYKLALLTRAEAQDEQAHALAMADKQLVTTQAEGEIALEIADSELLASSIKAASAPTGISWVDAWRGCMRPAIASILLIQLIALTWALWSEVGGLQAFDQAELIAMFKMVVQQLLFLTVTAVAWYFAARPGRLTQ